MDENEMQDYQDDTPFMTEDFDFRNEEAAQEQEQYEASLGLDVEEGAPY